MIEAKIIADSTSSMGQRITSMQLTYPRFIHAEFMTHRVFSRNASSSRAIPIKKVIEDLRANPAMPIHWGKNQPGMQAKEEISNVSGAQALWLSAMEQAISHAKVMSDMGIHKQVANRLLEPFHHIRVIMTSTEFDNWFELRAHEDAQPEIHELALCMAKEMDFSTPRLLNVGEWHLPYISEDERNDSFFKIEANKNMLQKISAARCCRVSYMKHDNSVPDIDDDLALFQRLAGAVPLHASPLEHQACPDFIDEDTGHWAGYDYWGNFRGWIQYRKVWEREIYADSIA